MILLLFERSQARRIRTYPSDGTLVNPFPFHLRYPKCVSMKPVQIPYYAPDGTSLGFRTLEVAKRLIEEGFAKPSYGRKGHLKAIWLQRDDGSNPVETHARAGTKYSFIEKLDSGRCWKLRRVDMRDEDGQPFNTRHVFVQVVTDCLVA